MFARSLVFLAPALALGALAACTSSSTGGPSSDSDAGTSTAADGGAKTDGGSAKLTFAPSNLDLSGIDLSNVGDFVVDAANCQIDTTEKLVGCGDQDALAFGIVEQPNGGGKIGVYVARTIKVEPNAGLVPHPSATYPLALVALDTFDVQGTIDVSADRDYASPGGYRHPATDSTKGNGPGGGTAGNTTNGGGGGGYCAAGGKGASSNGTAAAGGAAYGSPTLVPLVGGSAGGAGTLSSSGTGGGAVQLVAGTTFTLAANATVAANGGGGVFGGTETQPGSGGGSGGSILIEAPTVTLLGSLVATGGAGGAKEYGGNGKLDGMEATSEPATHGSTGGSGAARETFAGRDGKWFAGDAPPGGGGAAGRIRVNSKSGNSALSAKVLSPSANGPCTTEGTLTLTP